MFASDAIDDVLLGVPAPSRERVATCYDSKIGGSPLWMSPEAEAQLPRDLVPTSCSRCKKNFVFALQIYAPTDTLERALYVYCCPSSCSTESFGWRVLKDQRAKGVVGSKGGSKCNEKHDQAAHKSPPAQLKTDWLGLCAPSPLQSKVKDTAGTSSLTGGWNLDDDDSEDDDFSALAAMIDARDETLKSAKDKYKVDGTTVAKSVGDNKSTNSPVSNKDGDIVVNEPPRPPLVSSSSQASEQPHLPPAPCCLNRIEQETLLTEIYESECSVSRTTPSNHIDNLLQKYIDETIAHGEEDPKVISLLQQQQSKMCTKKKQMDNDDSDDEFEDKDDEEFNNNIRQMQGMRKAMAIQQKHTNEERQNKMKAKDNNSHNNNAMSKSDWAKRRKCEDYFQSRVAVAPSQVMRYAYGGTPLWCSLPHPPTDSTVVPPCPCCSTPRVFELQLMPALINYVDEALPEGGDGAGEALDLSSGFDFGVVTVWCCPNSCQESSCEIAVVQPPSDLAL